jgi:hypothetical protein
VSICLQEEDDDPGDDQMLGSGEIYQMCTGGGEIYQLRADDVEKSTNQAFLGMPGVLQADRRMRTLGTIAVESGTMTTEVLAEPTWRQTIHRLRGGRACAKKDVSTPDPTEDLKIT